MSYAILRVQKLKTFGDIGGSISHNYRTRLTLNADSERTVNNEHDIKNDAEAMAAINSRIPEKRRKDAVLCIEHLMTASPEWDGWGTEKEKMFFERSRQWLEKKYGKNNVISTTIHRDETTPHLAAYVVPIDEVTGNLNAKKFIGGTRHVLTQMQTDFAKTVEDLGLKRGREKSLAKHNSIKKYYADLNKHAENAEEEKREIDEQELYFDLPKKGLFESAESFEPKIHEVVDVAFEEYKQKQKKVIDNLHSKSLRLQTENEELKRKYDRLLYETRSFVSFKDLATNEEFFDVQNQLTRRATELKKEREIKQQFQLEQRKIREKALAENRKPSLSRDLKEVVRLQDLQDKAFLEDDRTNFKKAVARKYEILEAVASDLRFSDDVQRVIEYDRITGQAKFIDNDLVQVAENRRYTGQKRTVSHEHELEQKNNFDFDL